MKTDRELIREVNEYLYELIRKVAKREPGALEYQRRIRNANRALNERNREEIIKWCSLIPIPGYVDLMVKIHKL